MGKEQPASYEKYAPEWRLPEELLYSQLTNFKEIIQAKNDLQVKILELCIDFEETHKIEIQEILKNPKITSCGKNKTEFIKIKINHPPSWTTWDELKIYENTKP